MVKRKGNVKPRSEAKIQKREPIESGPGTIRGYYQHKPAHM
jgi:hypothetical protein